MTDMQTHRSKSLGSGILDYDGRRLKAQHFSVFMIVQLNMEAELLYTAELGKEV